jgi:hypothetical protein
MIDLYLCSPYTSHLPEVREHRFRQACQAAGWLLSKGLVAFSPIAHSHPIHDLCDLPHDWSFWERTDHRFVDASHALMVLMIPGWISSIGVNAELAYAGQRDKPVWWMQPIRGGGYRVSRERPQEIHLMHRLAA